MDTLLRGIGFVLKLPFVAIWKISRLLTNRWFVLTWVSTFLAFLSVAGTMVVGRVLFFYVRYPHASNPLEIFGGWDRVRVDLFGLLLLLAIISTLFGLFEDLIVLFESVEDDFDDYDLLRFYEGFFASIRYTNPICFYFYWLPIILWRFSRMIWISVSHRSIAAS